MKARVFVVKHILVKLEEMLELDETNIKIVRKSQNWQKSPQKPPSHLFPWKILLSAPATNHIKKIKKGSMIT